MFRLRFIFLLVSGLLLTYSAALAQGSSAKATPCKPQPALKTCPVTPGPACQGILRKAYSVGCRNKRGKSLFDGGCQCKGYCGYQCVQGCQADPECTWDKTKKRCLNAATGLPSGPLKVCKETLTPTTTPSLTPSKAPTTHPTATPTEPSLNPTSAPSHSPTVSYCRGDRKFLNVVKNPERGIVVSLSMSANGKMVLFSNRTYEYEGGQNYDFLWATRQKSSGDWSSQLVESYESDDYLEISGALSGDGKYLVSRKSGPMSSDNTTITFYKLDSKNSFKKQKSFSYATFELMGIWIDSNGAHAGISYISDNSFPLSFNNVNFIRHNSAWTVEWMQPLRIDSTSRDGNTALSLDISSSYPQKHRRIYVRKGKQWILQAPDVLGTTGPETDSELRYRGLAASGFSTNGDAIVLGGLIASDDYSDVVIRESGAWVMERSGKGNWTQVGPKIGGEDNLYDARATAISDNLKTIVMSNGQEPQGFKVFRKSGSTWTQTGSKVLTTRCCTNIWLSADGTTVLTDLPPTLWRC